MVENVQNSHHSHRLLLMITPHYARLKREGPSGSGVVAANAAADRSRLGALLAYPICALVYVAGPHF